jgi:hypothetical protein
MTEMGHFDPFPLAWPVVGYAIRQETPPKRRNE